MREVTQAAFAAAHAAGAVVIDVREPGEYASGHVPGARLMPLGRLPQHLPDLPRGERIYVICASGNRSLAAADFLAHAELEAVSVAGGTAAWRRAGRPTVLGTRPTAAV
jgi:rhodanese-related sulfurtransferase